MIDLHCHVLPDIDDGPADVATSVRMVRAALEDGIHTIVATPHVSLRYGKEPELIGARVEALSAALAREQIPISLLAGAEIALSRLPGLPDDQLRPLCLGHSSWALVESPYTSTGSLIEKSVFDLQVRGFRPLLAHPERCPEFQRDLPRLTRLVDRGAACSIGVGSIAGQFGEAARRFALRLLERGLVHNVASDAHDPVKRAPGLRAVLRARKDAFGDPELGRWLTGTVPAAILADEDLPPAPPPSRAPRWRGRATRG